MHTFGTPRPSLCRSERTTRWERIEAACLDALAREAAAWPKPGLVTPVDPGSHRDMDYGTFVDSVASLEGYFAAIARAGADGADFPALQALGRIAEEHMLAATGGANTHRGAIFNLGLLAAAAGRRASHPDLAGITCGELVARQWGGAILAARAAAPASHGNAVFARFRRGGAREEAASGFPMVYRTGLPALRRRLAEGHDEETALVGTLLALMAELADTNLLWRGGAEGLDSVRGAARRFNESGGVGRADWRERLMEMHRQMVLANLSPGGSADLVAAAWLAHRLEA